MTRIYSQTFPSTVQSLLDLYAGPDYQNWKLDAWLFDDQPARHQAEQVFQQQGITARLYSAYKPLLHFFLEDFFPEQKQNSDAPIAIQVHYPVHPDASEKRFLLEAYPLTALIKQQLTPDQSIDIHYLPISESDCAVTDLHSASNHYKVIWQYANGQQYQQNIFAPNRVHQDLIGETHLSPSGWIRLTDPQGRIIRNEALITDYQQIFLDTMQAISDWSWPEQEPYFEELNIRVEVPCQDQALAFEHEVISLREALHEDFYLSLLEYFKVRAGRDPNARDGQPGQIVPEIVSGSEMKVTVELRCFTDQINNTPSTESAHDRHRSYSANTSANHSDLAALRSPLSLQQAEEQLKQINGEVFTAYSRAGRVITARYHKGSDAPVMISGGQHANETTGVTGVLRAARTLSLQENSHFTICPVENPDGYALHQRLISDNPYHMHHAARYTALGDDLEYRQGSLLYEKEIRYKARALSQAQLHINLHGYPSHEWTRPLSGYVPRGFDMWTLPKGFFLILRHHQAWREQALNFIDQVTATLADIPGLLKFNQQQIALYQAHAGETGFEMINGFPCLISVSQPDDLPVQLITEYPDETIYDEHFMRGHHIQMQTTLAAYQAWQRLMSSPS